jgi:2-oxoglutarate dehydrogenase E1 component
MQTGTTVQITLPAMGESVTEGTVVEWRKQVGDEVAADETVVEVSTDKVDAEVPAPAAGVLTEILVEPDQTVATGTVLGVITVNGAGTSRAEAPAEGPSPAEAPGDESAVEETEHSAAAEAEQAAAAEAASDEPADTPTDGGPMAPGAGGATAPTGAREQAELVDVVLPAMGESVSEGTVIEWRKQVGDPVEVDETLVEISTDKVDAEVPAPVSGTLVEILAQPDETIATGAVLCRIAAGAPAATSTAGKAPPTPEAKPAAPEAAPETARAAPETAPAARPADVDAGNGASNVTPVARRIASEHGLDPAGIPGSGPRGRVTKDDVLAAVKANGGAEAGAAPAPIAPPPPSGASSTPIRGPAAALARFMNESRSIPTATSFRTLPVDVLDRHRRGLKAAGQRLSFTHLIAWAIVQAARHMPVMAHSYAEVEGTPHRVDPGDVSLGVAVDVERKDGSRTLMVPVIQDATTLDFPAFVSAYDEMVAGARDGSLPPEAYQGANITLTNPGGLGTVASVPRLMPGQGTVVATGAISYPPGLGGVPSDRLRDLGVAKVMTMTSTYDHRVIQGAESGAFLARIEALLRGEDGFYEAVFDSLGVALPEEEEKEEPAAEPAAGDGAGPVTATEPAPSEVKPAVTGAPDEPLLQAVQAATSVVKAHRMHGHLAANLDPLGSKPIGDPALDPRTVNLSPRLMRAIPASVLRVACAGETFADALPHLVETYRGTIAYEIEHIADHEQRVWLRQAVESGEFRRPLDAPHRLRLLRRLSEVEALETYLHKAFLGKKQFSIEGLDALVPMLDETAELAAATGAREVVIGMAHRGRLNVLAHTVGRPYEAILVEFEGETLLEADTAMPEGGTGDVKYHHGASGTYKTESGKSITITLSPNPSHLEFVNPVVEGRSRADQSSRRGRELHHDASVVVPLLIHGDAAFPGQGVVAETLNLQGLEGYSTGGTLHIITNNQLGFTTNPEEARSTRYASDLAKGFDVPIVHVNADDVEACVSAVQLCLAFRERFQRDAVIDLIGYRRYGHNETDEPAYTQPEMYELIKKHPPVRSQYADHLVEAGVIAEDEAEALARDSYARLQQAHEELKASMTREQDTGELELDRRESIEPKTAVPAETLRALNEQLLKVPEGFNVHRKLQPVFERRRKAIEEGRIDWAHAEALAFASLLAQGVPLRLTGQDTVRGTFSQRHLTFHDAQTGETHTPLQNLPGAEAPFELHNSPLSEAGCLGFEYGYSVQAPETLVLWEAQFGDFVNAGQVIVDQFITSGLAKWGQTTRLTLLLPHGYEGGGPEHSSARLERFLNAAAEGNIRVADCSTPAQYFHLLRRQALVTKQRPLVVMTPKSLLRLPAATSQLEDLSESGFKPVMDDRWLPAGRDAVTRLVLCSGKIFYDLIGHELREEARHVAVARVELLYPFAEKELRALMGSYPSLRQVVWVQEEPRNMGARLVMEPRLHFILPEGIEYEYVGRQLRASPGEGYSAAHQAEQDRIVREAFQAAI